MTPQCAAAAEQPRTADRHLRPVNTTPVSVPSASHSSAWTRRATSNGRRRLKWDKVRTAELFRRCREGDDCDSRDELIMMYLNLVQYLASRFRNRGEPIDDLVQVGTIGLIKAVDRFDPSRGLEFTTYATPTIVGEIKRHFRDKGWAMKVPRRLQELSAAVTRTVDDLTRQNQGSPTIAQIAQHLGVDAEEVLLAMESSSAYSLPSLDSAPGNGDGEFSLLEIVGEADPLMALVEDRETLATALKDVAPIEQKALYMRFYEGATQTHIAKELGVSQMQVSRMLRRALGVLRKSIGER
jgi:RNA polymerase sigma-B factor